VLAADSGSGLPLLDIFWTMLMVFFLVLAVWLVFAVLRDVFVRDDLTTGARVGWVVLLLFLPVMGSLAYQVVRKRDVSVQSQHAESRDVWRVEAAQERTFIPNFH
jgi:hypothetical protein